MSLREELDRIADRAPVVEVSPDTFARAQRARRRDRAATVLAAAVVVALVGGLAAWLPERLDPPVADNGSLGVPDRLSGVPERMSARASDERWLRDEVTADLATGRAAAAWTASGGLPVVVGAADGEYHLLDLPDYAGNNFFVGLHEPTIALSQDGRHLAYSWATFGPTAATEPIPSGIRVADLETGDVRDLPLPGAEGTAVTGIAWSPDGSWIGWTGGRMGSWTRYSMGQSSPVAGRIDVGNGEVDEVSASQPDDSTTVTIDDTGLLTLLDHNRIVQWDGTRRTSRGVQLPGLPRGGVLLPDGILAVGSGEGLEVTLLDPAGGSTVVRATGDLPYAGGGAATVLGTVEDRLLVRARSLGEEDGALLLLTTEGETRPVATVHPSVPDTTLTIATDLMTLDRPTVDRPEPDWPWSEERWVATTGIAVIALLLLAGGLVHRRARRRTEL